MRTPALVLLLVVYFAANLHAPADASRAAAQAEMTPDCAPAGSPHTRTTLYFGLSRPTGVITESQWKAFLRHEVTPRFPQGFTVWNADGQWRADDGRIMGERAKVLLVVHDGGTQSRAALGQIIERYKAMFQQQSVLWETARVCVAF